MFRNVYIYRRLSIQFYFVAAEESVDINSDSNPSEGACSQISAVLDSERKDCYYFYQAEDDQHIYMHNLNGCMLVKEYGSLENAPPLIRVKIVEIDSVSMTEALRKRLRYLQHLPLTCEFQVVELNFFHLLDKATLLLFESEINKRKNFRNRKARDERRRERFIEMEENKKLGKYPKATYTLQSVDQFPSCLSSDFQPLTPPKYGNGIENSLASENPTPEAVTDGGHWSQACSANEDAAPTSFPQKLRDGPKNFSVPFKEKKKEIVEEHSDVEFLHPPQYQNSIGNAIKAAALDSVSLQNENSQSSGKKKKGKKQQLLFSTSMCRKN